MQGRAARPLPAEAASPPAHCAAGRHRRRIAASARRAHDRPTRHSRQRAKAPRRAPDRPATHWPRFRRRRSPHRLRPRRSTTGSGCRRPPVPVPRTRHRPIRETPTLKPGPAPRQSADRRPDPRPRHGSERRSVRESSRSPRAADCRRPRCAAPPESAARTAQPPATPHSYIRSPKAAPCRRRSSCAARSGRLPK